MNHKVRFRPEADIAVIAGVPRGRSVKGAMGGMVGAGV